MITNYMEYISKLDTRIDAIMMVNRDGVIEYSGMYCTRTSVFKDDGIIGKHILDVYPELTKETSSHYRVISDGIPILNKKQSITDYRGKEISLITSTFPLIHDDILIETIEVSSFEESNKNNTLDKNIDIDSIICESRVMLELLDKVDIVAKSSSSILLYGETGTGKELFAQVIHNTSRRKSSPFVSIDCTVIPAGIVESVLFGTREGGFTESQNTKGLFEQAHCGTIFLDNIDSLDLSLQAKLLRAIETKSFRPIGAVEDVYIDVRIITALSENPEVLLLSNRIRSDLYYRLAVIQMFLPPLRGRLDDIIPLCYHYLRIFSDKHCKDIDGLSPILEKILYSYDWPGNVRELINIIEYAVLTCKSDTLTTTDIPNNVFYNNKDTLNNPRTIGIGKNLNEKVASYEKSLIIEEISRTDNMSEAADRLGISRQLLRYKMQKHGIM